MNTDISNDAGFGAADRVAPTSQKGTVKQGRLANAAYRPREYLTPKEIERLMAGAPASAAATATETKRQY
jgi:hypothetical protein